jgi:hypothetical protein
VTGRAVAVEKQDAVAKDPMMRSGDAVFRTTASEGM